MSSPIDITDDGVWAYCFAVIGFAFMSALIEDLRRRRAGVVPVLLNHLGGRAQ